MKEMARLEDLAKEDSEARKKLIAAQIRMYRLQNKLTQQQLAEKLGVAKLDILRWEGAQHIPAKLALALLKEKGIVKEK